MKFINLMAVLLLLSCNKGSKIVKTGAQKEKEGPKNLPTEVIVPQQSLGVRFICAGGSLNSNLLVFKAEAQPTVYPSVISLATQIGSQQILGIEELLPLYSVSESKVKVVFRAKEYQRGLSRGGGWQNFYYIADVDFLNRKIQIKKIGLAPVFNKPTQGSSFINGPKTHLSYDQKENKILLPVSKDGNFFYGWYSVESQQILSITNINALEFYNPTFDNPYMIFDHRNSTANKFEKTLVTDAGLRVLSSSDQMGPIERLHDDWLWLSQEGDALKLSNYSKQKSEHKNFALIGLTNERVLASVPISYVENKYQAFVAIESRNTGLGELRKIEIDSVSGVATVLSLIPFPIFSQHVSRGPEADMVIKGLFSFKNGSEILASFVMPDSSVRLFRYDGIKNWAQVSRATCSEGKSWPSQVGAE